jgi:DNA polymerase III delta prime subunit
MFFQKAERAKTFIKLAITGPSGSGKTYSALRLARGLVGPQGKIAFLDTENSSGLLYSHVTEFFHASIGLRIDRFDYRDFIEGTMKAAQESFDCVIIDSASHLWFGILDEKSAIDKKGGNNFTNWGPTTKHFNEAIQAFLQSKIHVISCMRSKMEYILEQSINTKGATVSTPRKIGLAPQMRDGIEYEFAIVFDCDMEHNCCVSKDRTGLFTDYFSETAHTFQITEETGQKIQKWLSETKVEETKTVWAELPPLPETTTKAKKSFKDSNEPAPATAPSATVPKEPAPAKTPATTETKKTYTTPTITEIPTETRETAMDIVKSGVITKDNSNGVITIEECREFCALYNVSKVKDLLTEQVFELADKIQMVQKLRSLIDATKMPPSKVNEIIQATGAKSLFTMDNNAITKFEKALQDMGNVKN